MYEHRFPQPRDRKVEEAAAELADQMVPLYQCGRFREAVALFSRMVPALPADALGDEQFGGVAHYNLALACHWAQRYDDARRFMELSDLPASGDFGLLQYNDRLALSQELAAHQERAIAAGKPATLFTALPKSASAHLSVCISEILDVPVFRVSIGGFGDAWVVQKWAAQINRGGSTTHEHYPGSAANIGALTQAGVRKIFVQIRDPRAAWWSFFHHAINRSDVAGPALLPLEWYVRAIKWLTSWIDSSCMPGCPLKVVFVPYDDMRLRPQDTIGRIFDEVRYRVPAAEIDRYLAMRANSGRKPENFRVGEPDDWRRGLEPELAAEFWRETPESVRDLLSMAE